MAGSTRAATLDSTRCICTAYGRAFTTRSCARRSFEAATIFIAFVICCVFLTARIRRRRSISDGIWTLPALGAFWPSCDGCLPGREIACEFLHSSVESALQLIVELLLLDNPREHPRISRLD